VKRSRVAKRYAQALFEAAQDSNALEQVEYDLDLLASEYEQVKEFKLLIDSPVISNELKQSTFTELFKERLNSLTFRFVSLLIQKNREGLLPAVVTHFHDLLDEHRGIVRGMVKTVVQLQPNQLAILQEQLESRIGKKVILTQQEDKQLLGGFVVKVQDMVFDASLKQQLNKLRSYLSES